MNWVGSCRSRRQSISSMRRLLASFAIAVLAAFTAAQAVTTERQSELLDLVHQDCGSCHGMRLTGGLGPPLTPQTLKHKSAALLSLAISEGRAGTPMPPWKTLLTRAEISWIVNYLKHPAAAP